MKLKLLALVLALQCAWLLATTFTQERALRVGQLIMLETRPVDPRDLLRGDYVIMAYNIGLVPTNLFSPPGILDWRPGMKVFVALQPGTNGFHVVARASTSEFTANADEVLLCGTTASRWWNRGNAIGVDYGIERYYVREGTGNPRGKLTVQAAVPASGRATIKEVFVDGQPYAQAMQKQTK